MLSEDKRIHTKQDLKEWLELEYKRYPLTARHILPYLFQWSEGAILRRHTKLLRTTEYHFNNGHRLRAAWYNAWLMRLQLKTGMHLPINCYGKGLMLMHLHPIASNPHVSVGENCRLMPFVKLAGDDVQGLAPTVGDNVVLGIGCTLVGGITLADGIIVGAGSVVTKSFLEPGIILAGVPAKKIGVREGWEAPKSDEPQV